MRPDKPTRDSATESEDPRDLYDANASRPARGPGQSADARDEKGTAESSRRDPPHTTEGKEGGRVQSEDDAPGDVPVLPANAQGTDKVTTEEHDQPIDDTSMYDGRRDEDKDTPPSTR